MKHKSIGAEMADAFERIVQPKPKPECKICNDSGVYEHTIVTGEKIIVRCFHGKINFRD